MAGRHVHIHLHRTSDGGPGSGPQKSSVIKPASSTTEEQQHQERIKTAHALGVEPEHMYPKHQRKVNDPRLTEDAGTSEGAKKAWQTRQHGGSTFEAHEHMQHRGHQSRGTGHYDVHHNNQKIGSITPTETRVSAGEITSGSKGISGKRGITMSKPKTKTTYLGHHEPSDKRFSGATASQVFNQIVEHHQS